MKNGKFLVIALLLLTYLVFPLITNIPGVLLPFWTESFQLSSAHVSLLGSAFFLAYGLTSLPQGFLLDRIGNKKTYLWAMALITAGSLLFALMPGFYTGLLALFIIGTGITAIQLVCNLLVKRLDENPDNYSRNLTILQVFCGVGGASGGILIGLIIDDFKLGWQSIYYIFGALALGLAVMGTIAKVPEAKEKQTSEKPSLSQYKQLLGNPLMLMFALGIFTYVGIEVGIATWISTYLIGAFAITGVAAAKVVSAYWLAQTIGRMTGGIVLNYVSAPKALAVYALLCLASVSVGIFSPILPVSIAGFTMAGFFTSIMFPCIFSMAVNSFDSSKEGVVAGVLNTAIIGGAVTAPIIGFIAITASSLSLAMMTAASVSLLYIAFLGIKAIKQPVAIATDSQESIIKQGTIEPEQQAEPAAIN